MPPFSLWYRGLRYKHSVQGEHTPGAELKDLTQRNECLDLKGEKLDYKACESLEEILKRVQFKVIDLEQTNLDEDVR
ncbi:hypothetical protein CHARACLAT_030640 [Characodon lateralis]|uniref:Uncharacterized protein n=1 Tax=Characodon lateralis TaxID=208331 RepID=A0ABU7D203_9TELE|nr:hypothetical protein [Characodon lateralis]